MKIAAGIAAFLVLVLGVVYFYPEIKNRNLYAQIQGTIHTEASNVSACKVIGVGARACGGPDEVVVYSAESTDVEKLEALVAQYNEAKRKRNQDTGAMSICSIEPIPEVELRDGHCVEKLSQN